MDASNLLPELPHLPGVYRMIDSANAVLYVGKARDLYKRVASYFRTGLSPRIDRMMSQVARLETTVTRTEAEALLLENNLIKSLKPRYNILFRDDKSYPYLMLTGGEFSRIGFHRGALDPRHRYFGPFANAGAVRESIQTLQRVFRLRSCEDHVFSNRSRPCLLFQLQRCSAPCVGAIDQESYDTDLRSAELFLRGKPGEVYAALRNKMDEASADLRFERAAVYRDQIAALRKMQERQHVSMAEAIDAEIVAAIVEQGVACVNLVLVRAGQHVGDRSFFPDNSAGCTAGDVMEAFLEQRLAEATHPPQLVVCNVDLDHAALSELLTQRLGSCPRIVMRQRGRYAAWLDMAEKNARLAMARRIEAASTTQRRMEDLRAVFGLAEGNCRIECFDVSHSAGEATVASCVVFDAGAPISSQYRRYNVSGITAGDDYAAMRDVLQRRYAKMAAGSGARPDLILVDGGAGQVGVARQVLAELGLNDLMVVGVAKGEGRKPGLESLIFGTGEAPVKLEPSRPALHLIQEIRDEAHRFAITGHRARQSRARRESLLDGISGVGAKRRRDLLKYFGSAKNVALASVEELCRVGGIHRNLAERIYRALH